jgi:SAM-dependent methyltransferase
MATGNRFDTFRRMLADLGFTIEPHMKVLDFGAGEGANVARARSQGLDAFGCDVYDADSPYTLTRDAIARALHEQGRLRPIETPYRLPFDDATFDVVVSDQVFEHVQDYPQAIDELCRVMRPGGAFLHTFPSRYRPIEAHIYVPFTAIFRPRWWLWLWALLGVKNEFQRGLSRAEVVEWNARFLKNSTHYLSARRVKREFARRFGAVRFVERTFLAHSHRARALASVPFGAAAYGVLASRFLFGRREPVAHAARAEAAAPRASLVTQAPASVVDVG